MKIVKLFAKCLFLLAYVGMEGRTGAPGHKPRLRMQKTLYTALTTAAFPVETSQWKDGRKSEVDITVNRRHLLSTEKDGVKELQVYA